MAVCAVLLVAIGSAVAALLYSGRPVPRHVFILDMVAKMLPSDVELELQSTRQVWMRTAA